MSAVARRYYVRAMDALRRGEIDTARDDLRAAMDLAPYFINARTSFASLLARAGEANRASQLLRDGLKDEERAGRTHTPGVISLHRALGEVLIAAGDYRGAEASFTAAAEAGQRAGVPQRDLADRLARLRAKTGRFTEALDQLLIAARAAHAPTLPRAD